MNDQNDGTYTVSCPSCGVLLARKPKRKKKCPHCGEYIRVRKGNLYTEKQLEVIDWLPRLERYGVTFQTFTKHFLKVMKAEGHEPEVGDVVWDILGHLLDMALSEEKPNYSRLSSIYFQLWDFARHHKPEEDSKPYLVESTRYGLLVAKKDKEAGLYERVRVYTCNDSLVCDACRALSDGPPIDIDEALRTMPVPNQCRSERGCRCWYFPVIEFKDHKHE